MTYHKSNLGSFGGDVRADMDGYVHTSIVEVMAGHWDLAGERMTRDMAREIARENREATRSAERCIAEWRSS